MTTRNIAPRENGEGNIGTQIKRWLKGWFNSLDVSGGNVDVADINGVGGSVTATGNVSVGGNLSVGGTATGVTPTAGDNSNKFATTAFVQGLQRLDAWQPNTTYAVGETVKVSTLPPQCVLICTVAGTSYISEPDCTGLAVGDTKVDGDALIWLVSSYLPITGGEMTGVISKNGNVVSSVSNNSFTRFMGGPTDSSGASLTMSAMSHSWAGKWELKAHNGTTSSVLSGTAAGSLQWRGNNIATTNNTVNLTGNQTIEGTKTFNTSPTAPTPGSGDNSTKVATTAFVQSKTSPLAPKASPAFTGTPTAPTQTASDSSTKIATTAYVKGCVPKSLGNSTTPVYTNSNGVLVQGSSYVPAENIGQIVRSSGNSFTMFERTVFSYALADLDEGTWIVTGHLKITGVVASKGYGMDLTSTEDRFDTDDPTTTYVHSATTNALALHASGIFKFTAGGGTVYVNGYTTAASAASTAKGNIVAVRIK